jgi:hypothetical protein
MHYELISAPADKHLSPKRSFLRKLVTRMRPKIMHRAYQRIPAPQRQGQIKPEMEALIVNDVRCEAFDLVENSPNGLELWDGLAQSGTSEGKQLYGGIQFFGVSSSESIRQYQQNVGMSRNGVRQADTVFPKIGGNQSDA